MKLEEVKALSDNELRIRVAELLGWSDVENDMIVLYVHELRGMTPDQTHLSYERWRIKVPNYPRDLNACHEMEETLPDRDSMLFRWQWNLKDVVLGPERLRSEVWRNAQMFHATARQRCEAFVLAMEEA